jgi:DnaJ-class molecular chaperone
MKSQPNIPNRGWRKRMRGVACWMCHGSGGGKNTRKAFVGVESRWMLYDPTCSICMGSGYKKRERSG